MVSQFRHRHPECSALCFDWIAWDEIGMAARPESRFVLKAMNISFMPPDEGADHVIDELQREGRDAEILVVDDSGTIFTGNVMMSGSDSIAGSPEAATVDRSSEEDLYEAGYRYGQDYQKEIYSYLREFVDRIPGNDPPVSNPDVHSAMSLVANTDSTDKLKGIAAGANVSLVSIMAHNTALGGNGGDEETDTSEFKVSDTGRDSGKVSREVLDIIDVSNLPLLEEAKLKGKKGAIVASVVFDPLADIFLKEHRMYGRPVMPGVVSAEVLSEAASIMFPERIFSGLSNLDMVSRFDFPHDQPVEAEVHVKLVNDSAECELTVQNSLKQKNSRVVLAKAVATFAEGPLTSEALAVGEPTYSWQPFVYPEDWPVLYHGPSLRSLRDLAFQHDGGRARLTAPPVLNLAGKRSGKIWLLPSALLDGCLVACGAYSYFMLGRRVEIPSRIGNRLLYRQPQEGELCTMRLFIRSHDQSGTHYDFHLQGEDGLTIMAVDDYITTVINGKKK
jgi:hypothetical protein